MKRHLLVTNDFPPKVGGIQNYLWDLWSRLDPASFVVLTATSDDDAASFDAAQAARGVRIERVPGSILFFPTPPAQRAIEECVRAHGIDLVLLDPALPLGLLGPRLGVPYGVILHGAEVTVPGRLPGARAALGRVLRSASVILSAGGYPAAEGRRAAPDLAAPVVEVPPGVDTGAVAPLKAAERRAARARLGLPAAGPLLVSVSRLVPRKGMDVLIEAANRLAPSYPDLLLAIGGDGRERPRLERLAAESPVDVRVLGRISDEDRAALLGAADVFVMACHNRWLGLEQEGFGIVFLEAAAVGVPQVAGHSGGASEAVVDGVTGLVVDRAADPGAIAEAIRTLLADPASAGAGWGGRHELGCRNPSTPTFSLLGWPRRWPEWQSDARRAERQERKEPSTVADQATEHISVAAPPERCFAVAADLAEYPEWAADIKEVEIKERDPEGRPLLVTFRAAAFGRSTSYTLAYDYSDAPHTLAWNLTQGDITTKLDGSYVFDPGEAGTTDVTYHLEAELRVPIPGFIKMRATSRIMATAMRELKARVESTS